MRVRERLADEVDARDTNELDVRMKEEAPNDLAPAIPTPTDHRGLETLPAHAREVTTSPTPTVGEHRLSVEKAERLVRQAALATTDANNPNLTYGSNRP